MKWRIHRVTDRCAGTWYGRADDGLLGAEIEALAQALQLTLARQPRKRMGDCGCRQIVKV